MFGLPKYSVFKDLEKAREEAIRMRLEHEDSQVFHQHMAEFYARRVGMINEAISKESKTSHGNTFVNVLDHTKVGT